MKAFLFLLCILATAKTVDKKWMPAALDSDNETDFVLFKRFDNSMGFPALSSVINVVGTGDAKRRISNGDFLY